jgi:hypothetical protein
MPRKRNARPDRYSTTEIAEAVGMTARNVIYLCSEGLLPVVEGGTGTGRHRLLDDEGLAKAALIAAAAEAGLPLLDGAALANALWPRLGNALARLTRDCMGDDRLHESAYEQQVGDHVLRVFDGQHAEAFRLPEATSSAPPRRQLFANAVGRQPGQQSSMFSVDAGYPNAPKFRKNQLFAHLEKNRRLLLEFNVSMVVARAALHMQHVKEQ